MRQPGRIPPHSSLIKTHPHIFWLKDESLEASDNLPDPDVIAQEIVDDLDASLEQFREIVGDLEPKGKAK